MAFCLFIVHPLTCSRHLTSKNLQAGLDPHISLCRKQSASRNSHLNFKHAWLEHFLLPCQVCNLSNPHQSLDSSNIQYSLFHNITHFPRLYSLSHLQILHLQPLHPYPHQLTCLSRMENNPPLRNLALLPHLPALHPPHSHLHHPRTRRRRLRHRRPHPRPQSLPLHRHRPGLRAQIPPAKRR